MTKRSTARDPAVARATFQEPQYWTDFRKRYAETGDPWIRENANPPNVPAQRPPANDL